MKQILTLSLLLLTTTAEAQLFKSRRQPLHGPDAFRVHMIARAAGAGQQAAKPTVIKQRVIAEAGYTVSGVFTAKTDTSYFKYSSGRGSEFKYDEGYHNYYFPGSGDPGIDPFSFGNIHVQADTVRYYSVDTAMYLQEEVAVQYTPSNKVADYIYRASSQNERAINSYDAQGRIDKVYGFTYNFATKQWDSASKRHIQYNMQSQVVADTTYAYSFGDWLPQQIMLYQYTSNLLTGGMMRMDPNLGGNFVDVYYSALEYYPNGTLKDITVDVNMTGSGLMPYERDSFAYDPLNKYQTLQQVWMYNSNDSAFQLSRKIVRNVNGAGLPDSSWFFLWDQGTGNFALNQLMTASYNNYNNPVQMRYYNVNDTVYTNGYNYYFYYQDFDPAAVQETQVQEDMTLFPVPTRETLHIKWKASGDRVGITLVNTSGQTVHSETLHRTRGTEQISVNGLAPGIYWLSVCNAQGQPIYRAPVVKL